MHSYAHSSIIYNSPDVQTTKCPSTDEWLKKMWCIYSNGILLSHKKERKSTISSNTNVTKIITLSEAAQKDEDKCHMILLIYIYVFYETETDSQRRFVISKGKVGRERKGLGVWG